MSNFCAPIIEGFGEEYLNELPILDLKGRQGTTGYIDFVSESDMIFPIMKGVDIFERTFLAIKYCYKNSKTNQIDTLVNVFFQRYTDDDNTWVFGTKYDYMKSIYHSTCLDKTDFEKLAHIFKELKEGHQVKPLTSKDDVIFILRCFACGGSLINHPDRFDKQHPNPDQSFKCLNCCEENITCAECFGCNPEWWYELNEIWDDLYTKDGKVYCQNCYFSKYYEKDE